MVGACCGRRFGRDGVRGGRSGWWTILHDFPRLALVADEVLLWVGLLMREVASGGFRGLAL